MGSSSSMIRNSEAVTICRGRLACLSEAVGFLCTFSDAHVSHWRSLKSVCESLYQFIDGIDTLCNVDCDDKLDTDEYNKVTTEVKEMVEEKNVAMLRIRCYNTLFKVAAAIKTQFGKASESDAELSEIIEIGKRQYHHKHFVHRNDLDVQAFLNNVIRGAFCHLSSKNHHLIANEDVHARFGLFSTLHKLITCERNLCDEVVEEEKVLFAYGRKFKEMNLLIGKGAEQQKLDPVLRALKKQSIMIVMSIEVIGTIAAYMAMLRDERLFPKVCQLVNGFAKMWSSMYECYKALHQAVPEENFLQLISWGDKSCSEARIESTKKLGLELIEWTVNFSTWINAQKGFIKALNDWLLADVCYAEKGIVDEVASFSHSSSKFGAPSISVVCNQWYQTIQKVSEKEVIISMQFFSSAVLSLWKKQKAEQCQKLTADVDVQKRHRMMEKEEKEIRRIVKAQSKKLMHVSGQNGIVISEENAEESRLHVGLLRMFESMEDYCAANLKVYDELSTRIEEESARAD